MSNEVKTKNKFLIPILCGVICIVIIVVAVCFALSGNDKAEEPSTEPSDTPTASETNGTSGIQPPSIPMADESSDRDNIGYDIFA